MDRALAPRTDQPRPFSPPGHHVNALMVWPTFPNSFWSFRGSMPIFGKKALEPPLGLLTVAALCPKARSIRLLDESVENLRDADIQWADLVMVSGMRVQRSGIQDVLRRARRLGKRTIVGGPGLLWIGFCCVYNSLCLEGWILRLASTCKETQLW
jgi:hypothetical protein